MNVTELKAEGLSRSYQITIPASDLATQLSAKIEEIRPRLNLKGFRVGKVPVAHVKKLYGESLMSEIVQEAFQKGVDKAVAEKSIRLAGAPDLKFDGDVAPIIKGSADLTYVVEMEVMPDFEPVDPATLKVVSPQTPVTDAEVDAELQKLADQSRSFKEKKTAAKKDDQVTIDFVGTIDGVAFPGGSAEDAPVRIGSNQFIPGFEEQLIGVKKGEEKVLKVAFPADYGAAELAGKDAEFAVTVKSVEAPEKASVDEALATRFGISSLEELTRLVKERIERERKGFSRAKTKRALFDVLDTKHKFDLPPQMVKSEFDQIWQQVMADKEAGRLDEDDKKKTDAALEKDYRKIAERRVRLGLVLAEIGRRNKIEVREEEVANAINAQAAQFPGRERQLVEFYRRNPGALAQVRAPIYEEKVVDFVLELAKVTTKDVSLEDLMKDDEAG
jgi:trigger factor